MKHSNVSLVVTTLLLLVSSLTVTEASREKTEPARSKTSVDSRRHPPPGQNKTPSPTVSEKPLITAPAIDNASSQVGE